MDWRSSALVAESSPRRLPARRRTHGNQVTFYVVGLRLVFDVEVPWTGGGAFAGVWGAGAPRIRQGAWGAAAPQKITKIKVYVSGEAHLFMPLFEVWG